MHPGLCGWTSGWTAGARLTVVTSSPGLINLAALPDVSPRELLAGYEALLRELRRREVVRTNDAPSGQYAEWLAQRAFGGVLAPNSVKSCDLTTDAERRLQVKARVIRDPSKKAANASSPRSDRSTSTTRSSSCSTRTTRSAEPPCSMPRPCSSTAARADT
jgi:hypothetical protein